MMGDNLYSGSGAKDFEKKFEKPYKPLLDAGVKFYAALGNHDNPNERFYKGFNMNGERFYTFKPKAGSPNLRARQQLHGPQAAGVAREGTGGQRIGLEDRFFHHPIYSSGGAHGSDLQLREQLEPLFLKYGVDAVFAGHEHFYERIKPQKGIYYFISGGAAKLREGDVEQDLNTPPRASTRATTSCSSSWGRTALNFQVITDQGRTVDSGALPRFSDADKKKLSALPTAR